MYTLLINTPFGKIEEPKQSFGKTLISCVGVGFAMSSATLLRALKCTKVHILDKDEKKNGGSRNGWNYSIAVAEDVEWNGSLRHQV